MRYSEYVAMQDNFIEHPDSRQLGSNPGGIFVRRPSLQKYYIKFPHNPEQAHVEAATAKLYTAMSIRTLNPEIVRVNGKVGAATKWNGMVRSMRSPQQYHDAIQNPDRLAELTKMHHAAIVTGNRDIIGLEYDNVMQDAQTKELVSADQGGSLHFRAMGDSKPFIADIGDVHSFQNTDYASGRVFSKVPHEALKDATKHLYSLTDDVIDRVFAEHNLGKEKAAVVKQRRDMLINYYK